MAKKKYKFKFSDMLPNAWFYKLRDMGITLRNKKRNTPSTHRNTYISPSAPPPSPFIAPMRNVQTQTPRKSVHFTTETQNSPSKKRSSIDSPRNSSSRRRSSFRHTRHRRIFTGESLEDKEEEENLLDESNNCSDIDSTIPEFGSEDGDRAARLLDVNIDDSEPDAEQPQLVAMMRPTKNLKMKKFIEGGSHIVNNKVVKDGPGPSSSKNPKKVIEGGSHIVNKVVKDRPGPSNSKNPEKVIEGGSHIVNNKVNKDGPGPSNSKKPRKELSGYSSSTSTQGVKIRPKNLLIGRFLGGRTLVTGETAVVQGADSVRELRKSMREMIERNNITDDKRLENLMYWYCDVNEKHAHDTIICVFHKIWLEIVNEGPWWNQNGTVSA